MRSPTFLLPITCPKKAGNTPGVSARYQVKRIIERVYQCRPRAEGERCFRHGVIDHAPQPSPPFKTGIWCSARPRGRSRSAEQEPHNLSRILFQVVCRTHSGPTAKHQVPSQTPPNAKTLCSLENLSLLVRLLLLWSWEGGKCRHLQFLIW